MRCFVRCRGRRHAPQPTLTHIEAKPLSRLQALKVFALVQLVNSMAEYMEPREKTKWK